jgi:TRAP-type C4-dicarboxylate transport system substrate-binding protein
VFSALETKTIDGQENPYVTIDTSKFFEVQKYISGTNHAYTPFLMLFSKQIWDRYTADEQAALRECAAVGGKEERRLNRELNAKSLEKMQKAGLQFNQISPAEQARMREKVLPVYERAKATVGADVVERVQNTLKELRAKNPS